jgi:DNA topoisomerase-1
MTEDETGRANSEAHRQQLAALLADPPTATKAVGLRYVMDDGPGIRRRRAGHGFRYIGPDSRPICDPQELQRIKALAIPPAWTEVWICPNPHGHVQATGRDAKGRKQYRYHPRWREVRDETKFAQMLAFGAALPLIRKQVERDLALPGLPRPKVLATVIRLLETTLIRVGHEEYRRLNRSFGLTTLRDRHVDIAGATLRFQFRGKSGKVHTVEVIDRRLARIVRRCQDLPGQELFQYLDEDGQRRPIDSADVNAYLRQITGQDFTTKDFRTWAGTVLAAQALRQCGNCTSATQAKRQIAQAIKDVAARLGNTPAVCRKCYVHPAIVEAYQEGSLLQTLSALAEQSDDPLPDGLSPEEHLVLTFLRSSLRQG